MQEYKYVGLMQTPMHYRDNEKLTNYESSRMIFSDRISIVECQDCGSIIFEVAIHTHEMFHDKIERVMR
jgi:hypothetical protein